MDSLETINPFTLAPWEKRTQTITDEAATELAHGGASVRIATRSQLDNPRQQSGQEQVRRFYEAVRALRREGNTMRVVWLPSCEESELLKLAKEKAKAVTQQGATPQMQLPNIRSTTLRIARAKRETTRALPENVGKHSKRVDTALPGKHTRQLYDRLTRKEAGVLAQLRTGMARLNGYLHRIDVTESDQYVHRSNMSFYLGGKSPSDDKNWMPNMEAVCSTIRFAIATGRLDASQPQEETP
ncbi:hypothetical protein V502_06139 [Pseudogymnoascus sp. VKM F-4520 (FW-2644)]|nr:hypothetical protein V502_06139 [Pseudogymnoascus sp. VKM F-4520 (FW-2644)]